MVSKPCQEGKYSHIDPQTGNRVYLMMGPTEGYVEYNFEIVVDSTDFVSDTFVSNLKRAIEGKPIGFRNIILSPGENEEFWNLTLHAQGDLCGNFDYIIDLIKGNCPSLKAIKRNGIKYVYVG